MTQDTRDIGSENALGADVEVGAEDAQPRPPLLRNRRVLPWLMVCSGVVGVFASAALTMEYLHLLKHPDEKLLCDLNLFVSCNPAMSSYAAHMFWVPNIVLGLVAFTIMTVSGVVLLTGARLPRWYWWALQAGLLVGAGMITYLQWFSVFDLRRLCLWCMIIWFATIPLIVTMTNVNLARGVFGERFVRVGSLLASWNVVIILLWDIVLIGVIVAGLWDVISMVL